MDESNFIYGKSTNSDQLREVKVKIPVRHVIALHGIKIMQGKTVSEIVTTALAQFFEENQAAATSRTSEAVAETA